MNASKQRGAAILALALALALSAACAEIDQQPRLGPVVAERIAELERVLVAASEPALELTSDQLAELSQRVPALVRQLAGAQLRWRGAIHEDLASIGDPAVPLLVEARANELFDAAERVAAIEGLGVLDTRRAADALLSMLESDGDSWARAQAAWQLAKGSQDWILPRLLLRLKYETDHETVIWIAHTLAHYGNYAGLDGLNTIAASAPTQELRGKAAARLAQLASDAGCGAASELYAAWSAGSDTCPLPEQRPSQRLELAIWREIAKLSGEHFQLRGVDDARFVLARCAAWVTGPLTQALSDEDVYVRVHVAQCLERAGPRAGAAGPALLHSLEDPALAPAAAAALGAIGYLPAEAQLSARLDARHDLELRTACARALGQLATPSAVAALNAELDPERPIDLRQTAARALLEMADQDEVESRALAILVEALRSGEGDGAAAETAIQAWLERRAGEGSAPAAANLARWRTLAEIEDRDRRRAERARCLEW